MEVQVLSAAKKRLPQRGGRFFYVRCREDLNLRSLRREIARIRRQGRRRQQTEAARKFEPGRRKLEGSSPLCRILKGDPKGLSFLLYNESILKHTAIQREDLNLRSSGTTEQGVRIDRMAIQEHRRPRKKPTRCSATGGFKSSLPHC